MLMNNATQCFVDVGNSTRESRKAESERRVG